MTHRPFSTRTPEYEAIAAHDRILSALAAASIHGAETCRLIAAALEADAAETPANEPEARAALEAIARLARATAESNPLENYRRHKEPQT